MLHFAVFLLCFAVFCCIFAAFLLQFAVFLKRFAAFLLQWLCCRAYAALKVVGAQRGSVLKILTIRGSSQLSAAATYQAP